MNGLLVLYLLVLALILWNLATDLAEERADR